MADLTGRTIGKYQLTERIGRGGMADVYKAYQAGLDRFVAVKAIHETMADSDEFVERFRREARSVANLRHPNILQVIDFDQDDGVNYMVMEYIQGGTLKDYLADKERLPAYEALLIARQVADALAYAHENGMVHRDVKPANIMFTDKSHSHVVLTDFGIARLVDASHLTMSGMMIGTPAYMSPESGRGETVDARADIYSLGVVLYELLAGDVPFSADAPYAVIIKHINDQPPALSSFGVEVPDAVAQIVLRCLLKEPEARYQNAADLRDALALAQDVLTHSVSTVVRKDGTTSQPTPEPAADTDRMARTRRQQPSPAKQSPGPSWPLLLGVAALMALVMIGLILAILSSSGGDDAPDSPGELPTRAQFAAETADAATQAASVPTSTAEPQAGSTERPVSVVGVSQIGEGDDAAVDALLNAAFAADESGQIVEALNAINAAIELAPERADLYLQRGLFLLGTGRESRALADFSTAIELDPNDARAYLNRANLLMSQDDFEAAIEDFTAALAIDDGLSAAYAGRGWAYRAMGDNDLALTDFNAAIAAAPDTAEYYANRGALLRDNGALESALADFSRAIELDPEAAWYYQERAVTAFEMDDYDQANEDIERAIELEPDNPYIYLTRGAALLKLGLLTEAEADLRQAVTLNDAESEFYVILGQILLEKDGPTDEAIMMFEEAIVQDNNRGDAYFHLGTAHLARDENEQALAALEQAVARIDWEPRYFAALAEAYFRLDEIELARDSISTAAQLNPANSDYWRGLGSAEFTLGNYLEALEAYNQYFDVVEGEPDPEVVVRYQRLQSMFEDEDE